MENVKLMTVEETANFLNVSTKWLYQQKARHKIPFKKLGGMLRFEKSELIAWLEENSTKAKK